MPKLEYLSTLTPKQHQALTLLAEGQSITSVAKACNIHRTTIHFWKRNNPEFAETLHDASWDFADHWRAESHKRAEAALALIDTFLADPKIPASVRLKAALHILTSATAPPPKFEQPRQDDPYRGANQLLAQMRADEAAKLQFFRDNHEARGHAEAAAQQNSSLFNTSGSHADTQHTAVASQPEPKPQHSSLFITPVTQTDADQPNPAATHPIATEQPHSSLFNTSTPVPPDVEDAAIRHPHPPTSRNKPCPCKSGRKYKHCCLHKPKAA